MRESHPLFGPTSCCPTDTLHTNDRKVWNAHALLNMDIVDQEALNSNGVLLVEVMTPSVLRTTEL